jgi:hypothetical protein
MLGQYFKLAMLLSNSLSIMQGHHEVLDGTKVQSLPVGVAVAVLCHRAVHHNHLADEERHGAVVK